MSLHLAARRWLKQAAAIIGCALLMVTLRVAWSGHQAHEAALTALATQNKIQALDQLSRSARWYLPGSSRVREALQQIVRLGQEAEKAGQVEEALAAYREARRCIRATRSMWVPNADLQGPIDERIAHLMAGQSTRNRAGKETPFELRKAEHLALLGQDNAPDPFWALWVVLAFFGWAGGAFGFVFGAWDSYGSFRSRPALAWGGAVVASFALWLVAMGMA